MDNKSTFEGESFKDSDSVQSVDALLAKLGREGDKLRDPVVLASLLYTSKTEREHTNKLFLTLVQKLDQLMKRIERLELLLAGKGGSEETLLPDIDQRILECIKQKGHMCAEEIQKRFNYRGTNAASARLNRLCKQGVLEKMQVGRKVFFKAT
ncbi:hypothetical protein COX84_00575 [Candidatus Micrarchaeota archaeon CG_4_10_14_0_2_um_filter_49_7]|nr:MAG: hypothetical protein COX84_00575 [Candidatus Micrarchaeota archaeon CG_4_10_14_0_2_um_filter_49_7]